MLRHLPGARKLSLVFDGDSIAMSHGVPPGFTLADQVARALPFAGTPVVVGVGGRPIADCDRLFPELVAPLRPPGLIFFHAGDNDIGRGADATEAYRQLTSYVARAQASRWRVVVSTELQRFDFPAPWQRELEALNERIRGNAAGADGIVDFAADPVMGPRELRSDPRFYQADGVHPTAEGYAVLVPETAAALRLFL